LSDDKLYPYLVVYAVDGEIEDIAFFRTASPDRALSLFISGYNYSNLKYERENLQVFNLDEIPEGWFYYS